MDIATVNYLNELNSEFYRTTAPEFDATRGQPWPGWAQLLPLLAGPLRVLDVGCGNGRLGVYLQEHIQPLMYHGMDNSPQLLHYARQQLPEATFTQRDIVLEPPGNGVYDLVTLFGVLHHIPGLQQRHTFIRILADRVAPGGLLAFASWRFYEFERFRARIVPWSDALAAEVEPHDYLLDWRRGEHALRYCHYVDDAEQASLIAASGLHTVAVYRADGFSGTVNSYCILQKPAQP